MMNITCWLSASDLSRQFEVGVLSPSQASTRPLPQLRRPLPAMRDAKTGNRSPR
jgi:hypothetical protein